MLASRHLSQEWAALDNARYYAAARKSASSNRAPRSRGRPGWSMRCGATVSQRARCARRLLPKTSRHIAFSISKSFTVVFQLRMVIDLYSGDDMILFNRLLVRSALRRCE